MRHRLHPPLPAQVDDTDVQCYIAWRNSYAASREKALLPLLLSRLAFQATLRFT